MLNHKLSTAVIMARVVGIYTIPQLYYNLNKYKAPFLDVNIHVSDTTVP